LTELQQEKKVSSTDTLEDNPKVQAFRREMKEIKNNLKNSIYNILRKLKVFKVKIKNVLKELEVHNTKLSLAVLSGKKGGEVVKAGTIENSTKAAAKAKANMEDDFCNQMMSQLKDSEDDDFAMKTIFGDISQSLKETNLPLTPLAYLGATCTSLDKLLLVVNESNNVSSSVDGLVSIVSMLLPHISSPVLRKESQFISSLITRVIHSNNNHMVVVCRGLKCVSHLIVFGHHTTWSLVSPLFSLLLSYVANSNLKVSFRNPKGMYRLTKPECVPNLSLFSSY
ncbi:hypothetical protein Tco_1441318, partial [Tanacetum coccineum]